MTAGDAPTAPASSTMDLALEQERVNGVAEIVGSIWHLGIAFCFSEGILDLGDGLFRPVEIDCRREALLKKRQQIAVFPASRNDRLVFGATHFGC